MINAQTLLYGIIGNPVRHSLSPLIHNRAFQRLGLDAAYLAFEVDDLCAALKGIRGLGIRGMSVTLPFKTEALFYLDEIDPIAQKIKAVNTIVNKQGRLKGYNTDWSGALEALEEKVHLEGKRAFIVGAGGSARAIAYGLILRGCQVVIHSRSKKKAIELAEEMGCLYESQPCDPKANILINCTPVGMYPLDDQTPVSEDVLREGMTVMDLVYHPLQTRLLRVAEKRRCRTIDGLEILIRQGASQFQLWTGHQLDIRRVREDLSHAPVPVQAFPVKEISSNQRKEDD